MVNGEVYKHKNESLRDLLERATNEGGVLIPDLQRSYVWSPYQVILLLDSIFRGWPFGSLLTWHYFPGTDLDKASYGIPARGFYKCFSGVPIDDRFPLAYDIPTGGFIQSGYTMILDGQQRLQSLILALYPNTRLRLLDYDWYASLKPENLPGRRSQRWSSGMLCLDIDAYLEEIKSHKEDCNAITIVNCLTWVIASRNECSPRRTGTPYPLPFITDERNGKHLIPLYKLWKIAVRSDDTDFISTDLDKNILPNHFSTLDWLGSDSQTIQHQISLLAKFVKKLHYIGNLQIHCLEVKKCSFVSDDENQEGKQAERNAYDDAIVNIFTRLNTAGRALTNQEITYAWLKRGWTPSTAFQKASDLVEVIKNELAFLNITDDNAISILSTIWCVYDANRKGAPLRPRDFLTGDIVRPMAEYLSGEDCPERIAKAIQAFGLETQGILDKSYLNSFNAVQIAFVYYLLMQQYKEHILSSNRFGTTEIDVLHGIAEEYAARFFSRWFFVTTWAGKWAGDSDFFPSLCRKLNSRIADNTAPNSKDDFQDALQSLASDLLDAAVVDAAARNVQITVYDRAYVSHYRTRLAAWQRTDEKRAMFKKLTFGSKGGEELQVDHIIPYTGWEQYISELFETGKLNLQSAMELFNQEDWRFEKSELLKPENALAAEAEAKRVAVSFINRLGNCSLLNWKYNDSKNRSNLGDFLGNVYEVKAGNNDKEFLTHWSEAMYLTPEFLHPFTKESGYRESRFSIKEFVNAIRHREEKICKDLRAFIKAENGDEKLF